MPKVSGGIGEAEGVVENVAVSVVVLKVVGGLKMGVGGEEESNDGVVDASVHVDEVYAVEHFVTGESSIAGELMVAKGGGRPVLRIAGIAPAVEGVLCKDLCAGVGDGDDGAKVVVVEVVAGDGFGGGVLDVYADGSGGGVNEDAGFGEDPVGVLWIGCDLFLFHASDIYFFLKDGAVAYDLGEALVVDVVGKGGCVFGGEGMEGIGVDLQGFIK